MSRFWVVEVGVATFCPAVADLAAPSRAELDAGTIVMAPGLTTDEGISDIEGWSLENTPIEVPDGNNRYVSTIEGRDTTAASALTFYRGSADGDEAIWIALAKGTVGVLVLKWQGDVEAAEAQCWPVKVSGRNPMPTIATEALKFRSQFVVSSLPELNGVVPAPAP